MSSPRICFFHNVDDVRYASMLQHIFNLLRKTVIKQQWDLNMLGKNSLCTCATSDDQLPAAVLAGSGREQVLQKIRSNFSQLGQSSEKLEEVLRTKKMRECPDQMSVDHLHEFICDMTDRALKAQKQSIELGVVQPEPKRITRSIELPLRLDQLGHFLGRGGYCHQEIMTATNTSIHVDNALYSTSPHDQIPIFNLESLAPDTLVKVTITGASSQDVESAVSKLNERVEQVKKDLAQYSTASTNSSM